MLLISTDGAHPTAVDGLAVSRPEEDFAGVILQFAEPSTPHQDIHPTEDEPQDLRLRFHQHRDCHLSHVY